MAHSTRWTQEEVNAYHARTFKTHAQSVEGEAVEADLHDKIVQECRRRGWLAFHGRMDRPTGRTEGEPDFVILTHARGFLLVECKSRKGKLSSEQMALHAHARHLDHEVHTVRSFEDFLKIL